ncbi:hypothetical protein E3N88_41063 [Mikania micrantha]|uniref:Uncharacterized protein n=1 Tax=Mikania micrantha TaxID=192012 RepID=A0A5N6LPK6_9ASTR|nr:hypothetical protein E3N88_41063 [Mikania micrantha]
MRSRWGDDLATLGHDSEAKVVLNSKTKLLIIHNNDRTLDCLAGDVGIKAQLIERKLRTNWPNDNTLYEAFIVDYNPVQDCSDEAFAAYLETYGGSLTEVSLKHVDKVFSFFVPILNHHINMFLEAPH